MQTNRRDAGLNLRGFRDDGSMILPVLVRIKGSVICFVGGEVIFWVEGEGVVEGTLDWGLDSLTWAEDPGLSGLSCVCGGDDLAST